MLRIHGVLSFAAVIATASLAAAPALAADAPDTAKTQPLLLCNACGMVHNIRRIDKPVAPERDTLPSLTSSPQVGGRVRMFEHVLEPIPQAPR